MTTYPIKLYITQELYDNVGTTPLYRADDHISKALSDKGHDADIDKVFTYPDAPTENTKQDFESACLVDGWEPGLGPCSYSSLGAWMKDWIDYNDMPDSPFVVLMTNHSVSGNGLTHKTGYGDPVTRIKSVSGVQGGADIADLPYTPDRYRHEASNKAAFDAGQSLLHELGHALLPFQGEDHETGDITYNSGAGKKYRTPMGINEKQDNVCNTNSYYNPGDLDYQLWYSSCGESYWVGADGTYSASNTY